MIRRRKTITGVVVASVMTIVLLNPVQTWSDSFVEDVPLSDEAISYETTSPDAAVETYDEPEAYSESAGGEDYTAPEDNGSDNVDEQTDNTDNSEQGGSDGSADSGSKDSGAASQDVSDDQSKTDSGKDSSSDDSSAVPGDQSTVDESITPEITGEITPPISGIVTPPATDTVTPKPSGGSGSGSGSSGDKKSDQKKKHKVIIYYQYPGGGKAKATHTITLNEGESFEVPTEALDGYTVDKKLIKGKMGSGNQSYCVTYTPIEKKDEKKCTLTIRYVDAYGNVISDAYNQEFRPGDAYSIASPYVNGYTATFSTINGTMEGDREVIVMYNVNAEPVPTPEVSYTVWTPSQAYQANTAAMTSPVRNNSNQKNRLVNPELTGFSKVKKVYALAKCDAFLNIREGKGYNERIVGVLYPNNLCYVIEDKGDQWVYVESGTVRGFVDRKFIQTGKKANQFVRKNGEKKLTLAKQLVKPADNKAFRYTLKTVRELPTSANYLSATTTADREALIAFSEQFLGNPYVWGGESLTEGCDCSGFTMQVYRQFGMELPRCSYEQAEVGTKIAPEEALPGDLLFYERGGSVYHVLIYIGNGQAINASSSTTGIIISNVDYGKTCWGVRMIDDATSISTQVSSLVDAGQKAKKGDENAQDQIINALVDATKDEWSQYGYLPSVLIAKVIEETDWLSFDKETAGGVQPEDNNVVNMTADVNVEDWASPWTGDTAQRTISQWDGKKDVYGEESIRTYEDMEACLKDYAAYQTSLHPEIANQTDVDIVVGTSFENEAEKPDYDDKIIDIIDTYNLTQYDSIAQMGTSSADPTNYTQEELELIWAIVAQEDDTSYEGALGVISSAMNRADANYGGYGTSAMEQLTADGQYCYSPKVSDPSLYQRRLGGNVPDFVIQAVSDCLTQGIRNNSYMNFRSSNRTGDYVQIGSNWYF